MIPKVINYCWFGKKEKPDSVKKCIQSWKNKCPDYVIKEWNEDNLDLNINSYMKEAYDNKKWAFVTDYARLWIIYNYGGFYLDTDVELVKSLDSLLNCELYFGFEDENLINTGLGFGATKKNKIIKKMLDDYNNIHFINNDGSLDMTTCVVRNSKCIENIISKADNKKISTINGVVIYPKEYFCPYDYKSGRLNKTKNTISIHWCNASWQSKSTRIITKIKLFIKKILGARIYNKLKKIIKK